MRTSLAAVTALTGSLLLPFLMLGSAQAVTNAPDLKNVLSTSHIGTVMPARAGGGGGFIGGGGGHMGGMGGGHIGGMGGHMDGFAGRGVHGGFAGRGFDNGHFNDRHFINDRDFHNRRFINNRFFVAGGWGYDYGYGRGCYWLRHQALVTGSPYWWSRYQGCVGYY
jgi:hypothetical protein